jgi:hypothetical protein
MRKRFKILLLVFALLGAGAVSGLALAQSSTNFDFGCWGVITAAGGSPASPNFRMDYSLGQLTSGVATSPNATLIIGYGQQWKKIFGPHPPGPVVTPDPNAAMTLYFPLIGKAVRIVRQCAW